MLIQTKGADFPLPHGDGSGTEKAIIVESQYPRRTVADGRKDGRRKQRKSVVHMYHVGPEFFHLSANGGRGNRVPWCGHCPQKHAQCPFSPDLIAMQEKGSDFVTIFFKKGPLRLQDRVLP